MKDMHVKIGDHLIQINCASEQLYPMLQKNFRICTDQYDWEPMMAIEIDDGFGVPFVDYEVAISKQDGQILFQRADYFIKVDSQYRNAIILAHDQLALKHALMNLYSSFLVYHNWGLLIHSSCAVEKGVAHIFSGHSGAGKSTAAKLSSPRELLSDEATLVKIDTNGVSIFNSPFRSELEAGPFTGCMKLASIQILHQALQNKRVKLGKSDALLHMMDKVFFWPHSTEETVKIMKLLTQMVKHVPVYELYFQKNNTFWELIS